MTLNRPEIGPQGTEMQELISQYEGIYEQSQAEVDRLTSAQARTQLEQFLRTNNFQLPREQQEIMNNEQQMRAYLAIGLAEQRLKPIRDQILQRIDRDIAAAPVQNRYSVLRRHFDQLAAESPRDVILLHDMLSRIIRAETAHFQREYSQAAQRPFIESGKNWLLNGGEKPSELLARPVPQLVIFASFRLNIMLQPEFASLRTQLGREVNTVDEFVAKTHAAYETFLTQNQVDRALFCPSQDFYKKLCEASGISNEMLSSVDTSNVASSAGPAEFNASQERNERFFAERRTYHEREKERIDALVEQLTPEEATLRASGNTTRADEIKLQIASLQAQARGHETHAGEFGSLIDVSEEISDMHERELMGSEAARALSPDLSYMRNLPGASGYIGSAVAGISDGMDYVGRLIPDTGDPMSWNAGGMLVGAAKVGLAAGGIINLIKGLAPAYIGAQNAVLTFANPFNIIKPKKYWEAIKGVVSGAGGTLNQAGSLITAAGTFAAVKYGTMENADALVGWLMNTGGTAARKLANNEYAPEVGHVVRDAAAYVRDHGPSGLKKYIFDPTVTVLSTVKGWGGSIWDGLKDLGRDFNVEVSEYESFFADMESTENDVKEQLRDTAHLQTLGMSIDIASVSSVSFGQMCQSYSNRNRDHDQSQGVLPLKLEELADGGFLYLNGDRVTKDQLRQNSSFISLPEEQRVVNISSDLSGKLIRQAGFWLRNYPDESRRREDMTNVV